MRMRKSQLYQRFVLFQLQILVEFVSFINHRYFDGNNRSANIYVMTFDAAAVSQNFFCICNGVQLLKDKANMKTKASIEQLEKFLRACNANAVRIFLQYVVHVLFTIY